MTGISTNLKRTMRERNRIVLFVFLVAVLLMSGCGEESPTVDMSDVGRMEGADNTQADEHPILRVAAGG